MLNLHLCGSGSRFASPSVRGDLQDRQNPIGASLARLLLGAMVVFGSWSGSALAQNESAIGKQTSPATKPAWKKLLPDDGLEGWEKTNFGGEGEVRNEKGILTFETGEPLTGKIGRAHV